MNDQRTEVSIDYLTILSRWPDEAKRRHRIETERLVNEQGWNPRGAGWVAFERMTDEWGRPIDATTT